MERAESIGRTSLICAKASTESATRTSSLGFLDLPGEVRNRIYHHVISDAVDQETLEPERLAQSFRIQVHRGSMYFTGIGSMALLFTARSIYSELASLVYSTMGSVSIHMTHFDRLVPVTHVKRVARSTYRCTYDALARLPNVTRYARSFVVVVEGEEEAKKTDRGIAQDSKWRLLDRRQQSAYLRWGWGKPFESAGVVQDLAQFLTHSTRLAHLTISVKMGQRMQMKDLLPLWSILGKQTVMHFHGRRTLAQGSDEWLMLWNQCVQEAGKQKTAESSRSTPLYLRGPARGMVGIAAC